MVWAKVRVSFRLGGNQTIAHKEKCPPSLVSVRFGLGLVMGLGGVIFLGGSFPRSFSCAQVYFMFSLPYRTQVHINSLTVVNSH